MLTTRFKFGRKIDQRAPQEPAAPDNAVTPLRAWLTRGVILASTAALLATSKVEPRSVQHYLKEVAAPKAELTSETTGAKFRITITATALGAEGQRTTDGAELRIKGHVTTPSEPVSAAPVSVKLGPPETPASIGGTDLAVDFDVMRPLVFAGNCDEPKSAEGCVAHMIADFSLNEAVTAAAAIDWSVVLTGESREHSGPEQFDVKPPWQVEIEPL